MFPPLLFVAAEVAAQWKAFLQEVCGAVLTLHEEENDLKAQGKALFVWQTQCLWAVQLLCQVLYM